MLVRLLQRPTSMLLSSAMEEQSILGSSNVGLFSPEAPMEPKLLLFLPAKIEDQRAQAWSLVCFSQTPGVDQPDVSRNSRNDVLSSFCLGSQHARVLRGLLVRTFQVSLSNMWSHEVQILFPGRATLQPRPSV